MKKHFVLTVKAQNIASAQKMVEELGFTMEEGFHDQKYAILRVTGGEELKLAEWFCRDGNEAPFPEGTLLLYTEVK